MVDLDSNPTKLIEIVEIGKQFADHARRAHNFSVANDVAKYFAIIPAMFARVFPQLNAINVIAAGHAAIRDFVRGYLQRADYHALIPLALRGVRYRPLGAAALLRRNLLVYGLGGIVVPFIGIKLIDIAIMYLHLREANG